MKKNAPLFIYDCDGTLELPIVFAYAQKKQENKKMTLSFSEFKALHPGEKKLMIRGMSDLIKYTANIGNNVLLSGGNPNIEGSNELKSLFPLFQNWRHDGQDVPFGQEPTNLLKNDPKVAQGLIDYFQPSKIIVIGDSLSECELAKNIKADILLLRGTSYNLYGNLDTIPHKHSAQTGMNMKDFIQKNLKTEKKSQFRHQTTRSFSRLSGQRLRNRHHCSEKV